MKIAILLEEEQLAQYNIAAIAALIFEVADNKILSVNKETIYNKNLHYLVEFLTEREISEIYITEINDKLVAFFEEHEIDIKSHTDLQNNKLIYNYLKENM